MYGFSKEGFLHEYTRKKTLYDRDHVGGHSIRLLGGSDQWFYTCAREEDVNLIFLMGPQAPLYCTDILLSNDNGHYHYQFDTIYDYAHFSKLDAMIIAYGSLSLSTRAAIWNSF